LGFGGYDDSKDLSQLWNDEFFGCNAMYEMWNNASADTATDAVPAAASIRSAVSITISASATASERG
jgi:hypothetical protein